MRWLISVVFVCSFARPARADLASALYGDVRDVIEELIKTEVTTSVVRTVGDRSPALAFYMHGTLERLGSPYWGSLGRVLKDDLTVAVSDFVYWHLSTSGGTGDMVASAKAFFGCANKAATVSEGCQRLLDAIQVQKRPLVEVECRRSKPTGERRVACHVGQAVLAALKGRGEVRHHLTDALADVVLLEVAEKDVGGRMRDVLTKWLDLPKDLPTPLLEALANPDLGKLLTDEALDKRCKSIDEARKAIDNPTGPLSWICFAITDKALEKILELKVLVTEPGRPDVDLTVQHWDLARLLADYDSDRGEDDLYRMFASRAYDARCTKEPNTDWCSKTLEAGSRIRLSWSGRGVIGFVGKDGKILMPPGALMQPMMKFRKLSRQIHELRQLVPPSLGAYLFYAGQTVDVQTRQVLRAVHRMARLVIELRARWYLWKTDASAKKSFEELDVAELLEVARNSLDPELIKGNKMLAFLDASASGSNTLDLGDWLRMVMRADYRSLAMESMRAALDLKLSNTTNRPHETFFLSLCAYLLDNSDGVGEEVARSAFKASAKQLLLSATHRGVPRIGDRFRGRLTPRLAVRLSFNDQYAVTDGDSRRRVVAADWPTAMVAINDYIGLEVSAIDFIAPLAEMALRPAGNYERYEYVALDLIRPRLGGWVAVPQFSRRISLSTGFGLRLLDIVEKPDPADPETPTFEYGYKPSLMFDAGIQFVF
ncbi:MAG: hypothetical protein WKG01_30330 [Kofleriaceae bacterium]